MLRDMLTKFRVPKCGAMSVSVAGFPDNYN